MTEPTSPPASEILTTDPAAAAFPPPQPPQATPLRPTVISGRRYGFLCVYCSSRLEAVDSMAGQSGTCPTCGNSIVIPILDNRGRLIDPTTHEVIKQDPHPVHAYAAAGHRAPQIVPAEARVEGNRTGTDDRQIKCPRCERLNPISGNNCLGCGLPFTMEGTAGDAITGSNTWAVASLVLGIINIPGGFLSLALPPLFAMIPTVPAVLALIFGLIALRGNRDTSAKPGQGLAIAGIVLGIFGLTLFAISVAVIH